VCRSKYVEPSINFGIVSSITSCILLVFLLNHLCYLSVFLRELLSKWLYLLSFISVYSQNVAQWKEVFVKICVVILLLGGMHKLNLFDAK